MATYFYGHPIPRTDRQCTRPGRDAELLGGRPTLVCTHTTRLSCRGRTPYPWFGILWPVILCTTDKLMQYRLVDGGAHNAERTLQFSYSLHHPLNSCESIVGYRLCVVPRAAPQRSSPPRPAPSCPAAPCPAAMHRALPRPSRRCAVARGSASPPLAPRSRPQRRTAPSGAAARRVASAPPSYAALLRSAMRRAALLGCGDQHGC